MQFSQYSLKRLKLPLLDGFDEEFLVGTVEKEALGLPHRELLLERTEVALEFLHLVDAERLEILLIHYSTVLSHGVKHLWSVLSEPDFAVFSIDVDIYFHHALQVVVFQANFGAVLASHAGQHLNSLQNGLHEDPKLVVHQYVFSFGHFFKEVLGDLLDGFSLLFQELPLHFAYLFDQQFNGLLVGVDLHFVEVKVLGLLGSHIRLRAREGFLQTFIFRLLNQGVSKGNDSLEGLGQHLVFGLHVRPLLRKRTIDRYMVLLEVLLGVDETLKNFLSKNA